MRIFSKPILGVCFFVLALAPQAVAGPTNPDISVIGDSRISWSEAEDRTTIDFEELEIAFVGPVNPYASAEVFVGVHGLDQVEVEEAKLLLDRYLPGGLGLTMGRYLQDFGQINQVHSHAFPFVSRPLMHEEFFGEDGAVDTGVRLDWLSPLEPVTLRASLGVVSGDLFSGGHHHDEEEHDHELETLQEEPEEEDGEPELGVTGRIDLFAEPNENTSVLLGFSVAHGQHDTIDESSVTWFGVDLKSRWDLGPKRALVLNAEAIFGSSEASEEVASADPNGWFLSADYRASRRWNFGGFAESSTERFDDDHRTNRYGGFLGLSLMEESTMFRLVGQIREAEEQDSEAGVFLQAIFGLGPHRPHRF